MRILFLTHSFNSLTQRLFCELSQLGHEISIEFDIADSVSEEAVRLFRPDLDPGALSQAGDSGIDLVSGIVVSSFIPACRVTVVRRRSTGRSRRICRPGA